MPGVDDSGAVASASMLSPETIAATNKRAIAGSHGGICRLEKIE